MLSTLLFGSALATTLASSKIRFGEEGTSLEDDGRLKQPFYSDAEGTWQKLTYSNFGLDFAMYTGGSSDSSWNTEGEALDLSGAPDAIDDSGVTDGVGTLKVSHTASVGDVSLQISREYTIATADAATATMLVKVLAVGGDVPNVRVWMGTRDDYVGTSDSPTKAIGDFDASGAFVQGVPGKTINVYTADEGIYFTTPGDGSAVQADCCDFTNTINQDPATASVESTSDGSYGIFFSLGNLVAGQEKTAVTAYAAGALDDLATVATSLVETVAAAEETVAEEAAEVCSLPDSIDPNDKCVLDDNGYSTLDADSDDDIPISLKITIKGETQDAFSVVHPATSGSLSDDTEDDSRYVLACPQTAGVKTVMFTVDRPKEFTAFGGEWLKLFPKDSWANTTNEYEPFTFNMYGAKIPIPEFRSTPTGIDPDHVDAPADTGLEAIDGTGLSRQSADGTETEMGASPAGITTPSLDAATTDYVNFYMEVKDEGDYELKYGNPNLQSQEKWVAVEFKSTLLRVGAPWADCTDNVLGSSTYEVGSIMPVLFGHPNLHSIARKDGFPSYNDVIAELEDVTVPVKVVLEVYNADNAIGGTTEYTNSANDGQCYRAGNACPEAHLVCDPSYCEIDVWKQIIADFKAASDQVTVLGSVGPSTSTATYDLLDMDGFYFVGTDVEADYEGTTVSALGEPLFGGQAGEGGVDGATVYVTLAAKDLGLWNPFSWYPYVPPSKWAAIVTEATDTSAIATLFDRGYGWVYVTAAADFGTKSALTPQVLDAIEATSTGRRLQGRRLQASAPFWGCDDTRFECTPICLKQHGVTTTKVASNLCAGAPMDQCACKCFHEAQWTCEGSSVVCKAKFGEGELKTVGDKVCETRGAPKPASTEELRVASQCEPMKEMRGSSPTWQCLARWSAPEPTAAPAAAATETQAPADATEKKGTTFTVDESFAALPVALAALALHAA